MLLLFCSLLTLASTSVQTLNASGDMVDDPVAAAQLAKEKRKLVYRAAFTDLVRTSLVVRTYSNLKYNVGDDYRFSASFRDWETDSRVAWSNDFAASYNDRWSEQSVPVADLKPGMYNLHLSAFGPSGRELWREHLFYGKPDGAMPWEGTTVGLEDEVPPPWSAPRFSDRGFSCWNREATFGGAGLVTSIKSAGRELLSAPVQVVLNGRPLVFTSALRKARVSEAQYVLAAKDAPVVCGLKAEFDGFMKFTVRYSGKVDSLEIVFSFRRELMAAFDDCDSAHDKRLIRPDDSATVGYDPSLKPFWWTGNASVGLMGGINDIRGWHLKDLASGYRLSYDAASAELRMKVVDTPFNLEKPRQFSFYLQATPTKPKNMEEASLPPERRRSWTGAMADFFDVKAEGWMDDAVRQKYAKEMDAGKHVYWYCASQGVSPKFPWWGWFGGDWALYGDPGFIIKSNSTNEYKRIRGGWTWACPNSRTFFDYKLDSLAWLVNAPQYRVGNLYLDLPFPKPCKNEVHGCRHQDDFGHWVEDWTLYRLREFHKRLYRILKKKDPKGVLYGHLQFQRTPSDVFFDRLAMGEVYERKMNKLPGKISYFDILKPEDMQVVYGMRANEVTIDLIPQIYRILLVYHPVRMKDYSETDPHYQTANRHFLAYVHLHNLMMYSEVGRSTQKIEAHFTALGPDATFDSYYTEAKPVRAEGVLWSLHRGNGKAVLVLLNDTNETRTSSVSVKGFSGKGSDAYTAEPYDFTSGVCPLEFGPRESRIIVFDRF